MEASHSPVGGAGGPRTSAAARTAWPLAALACLAPAALSCRREPLREVIVRVSMPLPLDGDPPYRVVVYRAVDTGGFAVAASVNGTLPGGEPLRAGGLVTHAVVMDPPYTARSVLVVVYADAPAYRESTHNEALVDLEDDNVLAVDLPIIDGCGACPEQSCVAARDGTAQCRPRRIERPETYCPDGGTQCR